MGVVEALGRQAAPRLRTCSRGRARAARSPRLEEGEVGRRIAGRAGAEEDADLVCAGRGAGVAGAGPPVAAGAGTGGTGCRGSC